MQVRSARSVFTVIISIGIATASAGAGTTTVILEPSKDNTLFESPSGELSNGQGPHLYVGRTNQSPGIAIRRALLAFDLSPIPAEAEVLSAELGLFVNMTVDGTTRDHGLHRVMADWGEGRSNASTPGGAGATAGTDDVTWLHRFYDTDLWITPGGEFAPLASATTSVGGFGSYIFSSPDLVADVRGWLDDPASNFGWMVRADELTPRNARRFGSGENPNAKQRPTLTIEYRLDPVPALPASWSRVKATYR